MDQIERITKELRKEYQINSALVKENKHLKGLLLDLRKTLHDYELKLQDVAHEQIRVDYKPNAIPPIPDAE
jgi:hypothetical protein